MFHPSRHSLVDSPLCPEDRTHNLAVSGQCSNQLSYLPRAESFLYWFPGAVSCSLMVQEARSPDSGCGLGGFLPWALRGTVLSQLLAVASRPCHCTHIPTIPASAFPWWPSVGAACSAFPPSPCLGRQKLFGWRVSLCSPGTELMTPGVDQPQKQKQRIRYLDPL